MRKRQFFSSAPCTCSQFLTAGGRAVRGHPLAERRENETLYPSEPVVARLVLGDRAREWPAKAVLLERHGLPTIDPLMGGRFWPAVKTWFLRRHSVEHDRQSNATMLANRRIRVVPFATDGEADFDGEKAEAARRQRRDRRVRRARVPSS